ncbi:tyrosine-type recombinase/integrase [Variibacter gotjawalensis]|uniref:tyrosine-type recombinase/integrase n=1 Tax=Variibacter gotjawalensis TaxID=1333996 RepID=UPI0012FE58AC|nr:site-specific integrase [Variibacter gotjawalensis]NIK47845.1 integrase [Variibacter gotjawalensis]
MADVVGYWLDDRRHHVKPSTFEGYVRSCNCIIGPIFRGNRQQRMAYTSGRTSTAGADLLPVLGGIPVEALKTSEIRQWIKVVRNEVGAHTANRAKMFLSAALALASEDFDLRTPVMPRATGREPRRDKKAILTPTQVGRLLSVSRQQLRPGIFVIFPFLTGARPSEQLGLLWQDIDFERNLIKIRRMQERNGKLTDITKSIAGLREIPMTSALHGMLAEWQKSCPGKSGEPRRVFPSLGRLNPKALSWSGGGGPLLYTNFRRRIWLPFLRDCDLPAVTPHSARHSFISTLQIKGVEIGLVAKLAGHADANVTLSYYTQAVRGAETAMSALEEAYAYGG